MFGDRAVVPQSDELSVSQIDDALASIVLERMEAGKVSEAGGCVAR